MAKANITPEEDLKLREEALAAREAELARQQEEFAAFQQAVANGENPDPKEFGIKNRKESLYDKVPLTVHQLDIIIGVLLVVLVVVILMGIDWPALLG